MRTLFRLMVLIGFVALPLSRAAAQGASPKPQAAATKIPQTADEHLAIAKKYQEQAASYRAIAAEHRAMAADYKRSAVPGGKAGANPWVKKMEAHCMAIVKDAEKLAADADKMAEFHTMHAKELQGK